MLPPRRPNANRVGLEIFVYAVLFASLVILLVSCAIPDDVRLEYGHEFREDSSVGTNPSFPIGEGDSDFVGVSFGWRLKPMEVYPLLLPEPATPLALPMQQSREVENGLKAFDVLNWTTKLALVVVALWFGWVYRKQLGRLIPGRNGS